MKQGDSGTASYITLQAQLRRVESYRGSYWGLYSKVARRLGVKRQHVSAVARGEKRSKRVEEALRRALLKIERQGSANKAA